MKRTVVVAIGLLAAFSGQEVQAQSVLVFDRGLPTANLNNVSGASRSNVAWSFGNDWITGDDFTIGTAGETWVITKLRGWSVQGTPGVTELGDRFQSVTLYGGPDAAPLVEMATGELALGSSVNSNPNLTHTRVQYAGGVDYQGTFGSFIQVWQHDFNVTWVVNGGQKQRFAGDGIQQDGVVYNWFNHASNAALSGSTQQGADNLFLGWDRTDLLIAFACDSSDAISCGGWDKPSDVNVQVFAERLGEGMATGGGWFVPEAANSTNLELDGSKAHFGFVTRNKKSVASGNLEFQYNASDINLKSSAYDSALVGTSQVMFEGTGTINGVGSYKFRVRAVDGDKVGGGTPDRFEIRIWTSGGGFESPLYRAEGNLGGGQVVVHKK